jgi:N-glycosidase YbiA
MIGYAEKAGEPSWSDLEARFISEDIRGTMGSEAQRRAAYRKRVMAALNEILNDPNVMPNSDCPDLVVGVREVDFGESTRTIYVRITGFWKDEERARTGHKRYERASYASGLEGVYDDLSDVTGLPHLRVIVERELQKRLRLPYQPMIEYLWGLRRAEDVILFYSASGNYGCFSNFSPHPIRLKGKTWPTSEHYFQAQKFVGTPDEEEIRSAKSPMIAARMGRSRKRPLRSDWESIKDAIMHEAILAKFTQHDDLREILDLTGDSEIVEHTVNDSCWGDGGDGRGKNMLGKILMRVREELRAESRST